MAWFLNQYECFRCAYEWTDEWSCTCDDGCPRCGARHMSPSASEDLTAVIEQRDGSYVVLRSPNSAEHRPDYADVAEFTTRQLAEGYLSFGASASTR